MLASVAESDAPARGAMRPAHLSSSRGAGTSAARRSAPTGQGAVLPGPLPRPRDDRRRTPRGLAMAIGEAERRTPRADRRALPHRHRAVGARRTFEEALRRNGTGSRRGSSCSAPRLSYSARSTQNHRAHNVMMDSYERNVAAAQDEAGAAILQVYPPSCVNQRRDARLSET